jgi:hypothetical protein
MALEYSRTSSQYDESSGRLVERWLVWDKAGTATLGPEGVLVALRALTTPAIITANLYPRKTFDTAFSQATVGQTLRLRDIGVEMMNAAAGWMAQLSLTFGTRYVMRRDSSSASKALLPVNRSVQPSTRAMACYRDINGSAAFPTGTTLESTSDIGGTKLDEAGNPVQIPVPQITVTLSSVIDSFQTDLTAYDTAWTTHGLTVNNAAFLGFPAYSCLLTDVGFQHLEDEYFTARIVFVHDTYLFFEQVAKRDTDGKVKIVTATGQASDVRWKRANVEATNWNASTLLPTGTWTYDRLLKGEFGVTP